MATPLASNQGGLFEKDSGAMRFFHAVSRSESHSLFRKPGVCPRFVSCISVYSLVNQCINWEFPLINPSVYNMLYPQDTSDLVNSSSFFERTRVMKASKMRRVAFWTVCVVILWGLFPEYGHACTRVVYLGPDGTIITGRSMDWEENTGTDNWPASF